MQVKEDLKDFKNELANCNGQLRLVGVSGTSPNWPLSSFCNKLIGHYNRADSFRTIMYICKAMKR